MGNFLKKNLVWPKQYHILFNLLLFAKCHADQAVSETSFKNNMEVVVGCKETSLLWGKIYSCEDETNLSSVRCHLP